MTAMHLFDDYVNEILAHFGDKAQEEGHDTTLSKDQMVGLYQVAATCMLAGNVQLLQEDIEDMEDNLEEK